MIQGLLLAAGSARRYGAPKLLEARFQGEPIAALAARHLLQVMPGAIAVVADAQGPLAQLFESCGARTVVNPQPQRGMGSSIAIGVAASRDAAGWVVALADMPWLRPCSIAAVVAALNAGAGVAATRFQNRRGHPVGFAAGFREQLLQLDGGEGARSVLANADQVVEIEVNDPGVLLDVDVPEDLGRAPTVIDPGQ